MTTPTQVRKPLATVDVRELNSLRWGPLRQMFPVFVEEIELGRYLKQLLSRAECRAVEIQPHRDPNGRASDHVFDVFVPEETTPGE
ncbi:MAG TPA: hypothetical protein VF937_02460 [Chloroflexota bacterium]